MSRREPVGDPGAVADAVAEAALAVPGVYGLHGGDHGEVATYLPGRRVSGVRLLEPGCEVHLVVDWSAPLMDTIQRVRDVVRPIVGGPVHVTVEDVARRDRDRE